MPGGRKKGKHENIELRHENSSLGTWLQSSLKLRWPHVLFAWGQLTYTCCPSSIIDNILFTQKYCSVDNEVHCYPPWDSCLARSLQQSGMDLQTCTCMCVCVSPGCWESCSETRHWWNGRHFQELLSTDWDSNLRMIHRNHFPNSRMALTWCMICCFAVGKPGSDNSWERFFPLCLFC